MASRTSSVTQTPEERSPREGQSAMEYWGIWYPKAAATGLLLGRGFLDQTDHLLIHAAPDVITVEVTGPDGRRLCYAQDLERTTESPMCRLRRDGSHILREDFWPGQEDIGSPVMLAGGEVGRLERWWHSADKKEWRWSVEFYNSSRSPQRDSWSR